MLYDYSDAYILVSRTITITALAAGGGNHGKNVTFKTCPPFNDSISKINNTEVDNAIDIYIVMLMCNVIEYGNNYYRDELSLSTGNDTIVDFSGVNHFSQSFKYKKKHKMCNRC